jgi:hypothetical protein
LDSADTAHESDAVKRAAGLAAAAADTTDPDIRAKIEAELNAALADVEAGLIDLDELVAALAALAGHAIDEAASLRVTAAGEPPARGARDEQRAAVLQESLDALPASTNAAQPEPVADPMETPPTERRSAVRRVEERRRHGDDSPPARVNRWLHGERRDGFDRRTGIERRESPPSDAED